MPIPLGQLADQLGAEVDRVPSDVMIHGVASIPGAREGCLVFVEDETSLAAALASAAAAVLVGQSMASGGADKPWMSWTLARLMPTSRVPKKTSLR